MRVLLVLFSLFALSLATASWAHPHVFVDAKLRVQVSADGDFEGVEVQWTYDDFYSLLLLSDMGLDPDGDGQLDAAELVQLEGFDLQWIEGFAGDTIATRNNTPVALGVPEGRGVTVKNGRISTTHFRAATGPADGVVIKAFDLTFYTGYSLIGPVEVSGPCAATIHPADLDAAYSMVEKLLYATPVAEAQDDYPEVGEAFADTVTLSCTP